MAVRRVAHLSIDEREALGLEARDRTPVSSHTRWRPAADRPDPVALLEEQNLTREPDLVPVREHPDFQTLLKKLPQPRAAAAPAEK